MMQRVLNGAVVALTLGFVVMGVRHALRHRARALADLTLVRGAPRGRPLAVGLGIGALAVGAAFTGLALTGHLRVPGAVPDGAVGLLRVLWMAPVALLEEVLHRVGVLRWLQSRLPSAWAVAVSSALFGLSHAVNPGATPLSVLSNTLGGVMYAVAFLGSGSIALSLGIHIAWNAMQGPVLGLPVSGLQLGGLLRVEDAGPAWLTGGSYGLEGGAAGIAARALVLLLTLLSLRAARAEQRSPAAS